MSVQQRAFHVLQRGSLQALYFTYILSLLLNCCILPVKCAPPATVNDRPTSTNDFNAKSWFENKDKSVEKTIDSAKKSKNDGDFELSQNRNPADKEATAGTGGGSLRQPEPKSNASPQKEQDRGEKADRPSVNDESQTPRQESAKSREMHEPRPRTDADKTSSDVKSSLAAPPTETQSDQAVPARYGSSKLTGNADKEPNPPSSNGVGQSEKTATQSLTRNGGGGDQQRVSVPKSSDKKDTESDRTQTTDKTADSNVGKRRETESKKTETKPSTGAVGDTDAAQEEEEKEEQVTTAPYNWTMPAHLSTYVEDITTSLQKIRNAGITEDPRVKALEKASMEPATPNATARDLSDHERLRMSGNVDDEMKNRQSAGKTDTSRKDSPSTITDRPAASGAVPGSRPVSGGNSEKSRAGQQQPQQQSTAQDTAPKKSLESTGLVQQTSLDARNQSSKLKNETSATITGSNGVKQQSLKNRTTSSADVQMKPAEISNKTAPKSDKPTSSVAQPSAPSANTSGESQKTMESKKEIPSTTTTTETKKNEDQTGNEEKEEDYEEREDQQPQPPPQTSDRQSQEEFGKDTNKSEVKPQTANKQPADIGQPKPQAPSIKPESEDSHFMLYMVTGIISVALIYLLYHNKQKILGLIVEGRVGSSGGSTRRHNGRRYRKLEQNEDDSGFTKPTNIIY